MSKRKKKKPVGSVTQEIPAEVIDMLRAFCKLDINPDLKPKLKTDVLEPYK